MVVLYRWTLISDTSCTDQPAIQLTLLVYYILDKGPSHCWLQLKIIKYCTTAKSIALFFEHSG